MMITVTIAINGKPVYLRSAVNVSNKNAEEDEVNQYRLDDGTILKHTPNDGVIPLVQQMVNSIHEVG